MAPVQARERTSPVEAETLKGRVAFVTGGTRGIGAAIGRSFAMRGATVAAGYSSNEEAARAFKEELEGFGVPASIHRGDVASYEDCQRTMHHVLEQHGRLDILVNNAGITADKSILKMEEDDWYKVLGVNLSGAFFTSKAALGHMLDRGTGDRQHLLDRRAIGNIGQSNYAASKSGLFGLTMTLAREAAASLQRSGKFDPDGIGLTVNCVAPGFIETEMLATVPTRCSTRSGRRSRSVASGDRRRSRASCTSCARTPPPTSRARSGRSTAVRRCRRAAAAAPASAELRRR